VCCCGFDDEAALATLGGQELGTCCPSSLGHAESTKPRVKLAAPLMEGRRCGWLRITRPRHRGDVLRLMDANSRPVRALGSSPARARPLTVGLANGYFPIHSLFYSVSKSHLLLFSLSTSLFPCFFPANPKAVTANAKGPADAEQPPANARPPALPSVTDKGLSGRHPGVLANDELVLTPYPTSVPMTRRSPILP